MAQVTSIKAGQLTQRQAAPRVGSIISPHREGVVDTLSPQALGNIMKRADEGDVEAYLTLAEEMEEREPHYASVLFSRKLAVSAIQPQIEAPKDAVSTDIIEAVEDRITTKPAFEGLVLDLMDGVPKGFSCVEIVWDFSEKAWNPVDYEFRPQRHFVFDKDTMTTPRLRTDAAPQDGEELQPYKWIPHMPKIRSGIPIRTGLARTVSVCYAAKRWTVADWMAFLDIYGVPVRIGKYPTHMAKDKAKLLRAVRAIGSDAAAVIPSEMEVEIIEAKGGASGGGVTLFQQGAEYWDKQTSKVVLGQTMTTDDGSSLAQAKIHQNVAFAIRDADSRAIAATINEYLIKPFVDLNFGPQKVYPAIRIKQRQAEDLVPLLTATQIFVNLGGKVQASEVRDRLGYPEPEEDAELLQPIVPKSPAAGDDEPPNESSDKGPAKPSDKVQRDDKKQAEINAAQDDRIFDETDETARAELEDWRSLEEDNVGEAIAALQTCSSYEEAGKLLDQLKADAGDRLDIETITNSLAKTMFKLRGIGDATDEVKP